MAITQMLQKLDLSASLMRRKKREVSPEERQRKSNELLRISALETEALLNEFQTSSQGLSPKEVKNKLQHYGENVIAKDKKPHLIVELLARFLNPLNLLLLGLATISLFIEEVEAAEMMTAMVFLSVLLSYFQEYRSNHAAEKLRNMVSNTATVWRRLDREEGNASLETAGRKEEVSIEHLVPGDVLHLSAGDMVPGDVRIIAAKDLFVNQSALTGESMPVEKFSKALPDVTNPLEASNLCFMGSNILSGVATAVVVSTGGDTYFGALASTLVGYREPSSFDKGIVRCIFLMIAFMSVMVPFVFVVNGVLKHAWVEALMFSLSVAVGLTPEMLPMIVTINLAKGAIKMSRKDVIVKRLNAIQNFGAIDVLCTDKTGTLTQDKVILEQHLNILGDNSNAVLQWAYLNSYYQTSLKNLLDRAILEQAEHEQEIHLLNDFKFVDEVPFDFARRSMSVAVHNGSGETVLITKGAAEEILSHSTTVQLEDKVLPFNEEYFKAAKNLTQTLNEDGFRVIAVAIRRFPVDKTVFSVADESELTLLGFMAFLDPPKESAKEAIEALATHGIDVKILTGDNDAVTLNVCRQVDFTVHHVLLGSEIEQLSDAELALRTRDTQVFAKLSPDQKVRVIKALHLDGRVVGFLGDGINDGPAMRAADVSISVDTAVDIAKESADIILLEKSLMVLEEGVLEGRQVFGNILKYIRMTASSNFGNVFTVIGASIILPFLPMAPVQILLNNLLYDFSQTTVATDHVDKEYTARPRKWDIKQLARFIVFIGPISSLFDYATFAVLWFALPGDVDQSLFQTGWFVESLLSQTLIVHIIRTNKIPFLQSRPSWPLLTTTITICAIGIMLPYSFLADNFSLVPLPADFWPWLALILLSYMLLTQTVKLWMMKRFNLI